MYCMFVFCHTDNITKLTHEILLIRNFKNYIVEDLLTYMLILLYLVCETDVDINIV